MKTKKRSKRFAPVKVHLGMPLLVLLLIVTAARTNLAVPEALDRTATKYSGIDIRFKSLTGNVLLRPETLPHFPGGNGAMMKFMLENLNYPEDARKRGKEGIVYVQFTVTGNGNIKEVKVKKPVEGSLDAEAVRVVSMMPDWIPGEINGKPVSTILVLPVNFKLEKG